MVSLSRRAAPPHFGQVTSWNDFESRSGERPVGVKSTSRGSSTGRSFGSTGCAPHVSHQITGIGAPQ